MKKILLSLLIFCSVILQAQIQIPQVVGLTSALNSKVDKVTGKSLVADSSIIKLNGIQSGAQVNILEGVQRNGANLTITGKKVNVIVPTTPSEVGAEPANINIQSHISSTSNPHSVTKAQVGLGNVDNTSDVNKPISSATQTALDGKQLIGTYATGSGTAYGNNTGDETLTSIKTKLGAASAVSDGYLKYQDWNLFNSKEPAITKNTAFNKNFGTTPGTVLEGRTFGTAANSAVGDFQPIENQRLSTANSPSFNKMTSTVATGTAPLTVNSTTMVGNLNAQFINGTNLSGIISEKEFGHTGLYLQNNTVSWLNSAIDGAGGIPYWTGNFLSFGENNISYKTQFLISKTDFKFRGTYGNEDTQFNTIYHSGNLTNTLSTSYIPKWNGSNFVNATAGTDYQRPITLTTNGTSGAATFSGNVLNVPNYAESGVVNQTLTTVNGSTSGNMVCSMPFQTGSYKKVIIYVNSLNGSATYTFPTQLNNRYSITTNTLGNAYTSVLASGTSVTINGATNAAGVLIIEGY